MLISHWYKLFDHLQASPQEFYAGLERAVAARKIPALRVSRVGWLEGGLLSGRREYLRLKRERLFFDICAAPFGTGFFISSRLSEQPLRLGLFAMAFLLTIVALVAHFFARVQDILNVYGTRFFFSHFTYFIQPLDFVYVVAYVLLSILIVWFFRTLARRGWRSLDTLLMCMPIVSYFYERYFRALTYYRIDTMLMFLESVHHALLQATDELTEAKGVRGLLPDERKPILTALYKS